MHANAWPRLASPPQGSAPHRTSHLAHQEPLFTNFTGPPANFVGTLDYICTSAGHWSTSAVKPLLHRDTVLPTVRSYPIASEPSDHTSVWADLELLAPAAVAPGGGAAGAA